MKSSCSPLLEKSSATVCKCAFSYLSFSHVVGLCMYVCIHFCSLILRMRYVIIAFNYKWFYVLVWLLLSFRVTIFYKIVLDFYNKSAEKKKYYLVLLEVSELGFETWPHV